MPFNIKEPLLNKLKDALVNNADDIANSVLKAIEEYLNKEANNNPNDNKIMDNKEKKNISELFKNFFKKNYSQIESKIIIPNILNPTLKEIEKYIDPDKSNKEKIKNSVKDLLKEEVVEPISEEGWNIDFKNSEIPKILEKFKNENLKKIQTKIKTMTLNTPPLNNLISLLMPDSNIEKFAAGLDLAQLNAIKESLIFEPNEYSALNFDSAKYYINELNFYNSKNSTGIDPLVNSVFKGQIKINKFIIEKLKEYRKEKTFFKKYKEQLEEFETSTKKFTNINHKNHLNKILSSLKKMYNIIYVINQKIQNTERFSSKKIYIYYLNTYTSDKSKITNLYGNIKTWDDFIEKFKNINSQEQIKINNNLTEISKTPLKNNPNPTAIPHQNVQSIKEILNYYLGINSETNLREVKKQSPYTSTEKGAKKFISKQKEKISSKITNYIKTFSNDYLLGDRILLCPYINNKYLDFKLAKDTISFLKEYNKASDKIMKNWIKYIDIPQQKSINKELINALDEYRSNKNTLEKILQSKKINYQKLINTKIKMKKDLERIKKVCTKSEKDECKWVERNIKSIDNSSERANKEDNNFITTFNFMTQSCRNNNALLWQDYLGTIKNISDNTLQNLNNIINLNPSNNNIQINYTNLKMKTIDYKILSKKELNKNDEISEENFRKERYRSDIGKIEEKSKYSDTIDKLNLKYKKQSDSITLLNNQIESQKKFFNLQINKINIFSVKESENSKIMNHILSTFTNDHDKIKGKYQNLINLYRTNYKMSLLEKMLNLKNKIEIQKKYISKLKDLYKKINNHCKDATNTLLKIQSTITKSKNKYNSSYKIYNKYITKKALASNPEIIPNENNDIFVILTKEEINSDNQNIINDKMVKVKKALNDLLPDKEENANNLDKSSYLTLLSDYVNFIAEKIKKATT